VHPIKAKAFSAHLLREGGMKATQGGWGCTISGVVLLSKLVQRLHEQTESERDGVVLG